MTLPDETIPPLSDSMERRLRAEEARAPKPRQRIRTVRCVIPDCDIEAQRRSSFPVCINHLLLIWKQVDGGDEPTPWAYTNGMLASLKDPRPAISPDEIEARRLAARQKQREIATTPGTLYVLDTLDGGVKIGWTGRPLHERLDQYPPKFRLIVSVPGTRADERDTHRSLKMFCESGREWYRLEGEVVRQINAWIALSNTIEAQRAQKDQEQLAYVNPGVTFNPGLLPKFESLEQWWSRFTPVESLPAPSARSGARRVA